MSAKTKSMLIKALYIFGGACLIFSFMRAQKVSSTSGGKVTLAQALQADVKSLLSAA